MKKIIVFVYILLSILAYGEVAYIASFNTLHLGWNEEKRYDRMAEFLSFFDLVALQEVMDERGLEELVDELNHRGEERWEYHISPYSVGSGEYREYYAFIWKGQRVKFIGENGYYQGRGRTNFERPPYGATFKIGEFDLILVSCHSIFGKSISERRAEALQMEEVYEYYQGQDSREQDILLAGDFNLPAYDEAFSDLLSHKDQLYYGISPKNKTTIGKKGLSSSYDNIFYSYKYTGEYTGNSGIIDFTNGRYREVRKAISDHLPVFIEVDITRDDD
ncbi:LuxR family transcriptional regulator [Propionigenium maris DSM 9537]|uniref:LuxR family transcriptional regulator n=1 Tax=Propionigenium maris DSM 9537 TaxID=1123000 RepID=A0A9W6GMY1_9FUSO|nr:endonuclease/exonuclease/phosphatase family protein [Propionigenium maris]GLI56880.1 LuxR family transcriptional regulator [Propionigenium maris DSM 9537]